MFKLKESLKKRRARRADDDDEDVDDEEADGDMIITCSPAVSTNTVISAWCVTDCAKQVLRGLVSFCHAARGRTLLDSQPILRITTT